ncbi:MAG: DUF3616 domain-containing protein [Limisphaerales bacterium]
MRTLAAMIVLAASGLAGSLTRVRAAESADDGPVYRGCCDASAAAVINESLIAVASDEENMIRLYRRGSGGMPVALVRTPVLSGLDPGRNEMDLEGAARIGDLIFWIGSHSRNDDGEARPARHILFATRIVGTRLSARLEPEGRPFHGLVPALTVDPALDRFRFSVAAGKSGEASGGLNIEALAAGAGGKLWIGFRNPVPDGKALMIPLLNPVEVMAGHPARFGTLVQLALGGLGLRDAVAVGEGERLLLLGGPAEGGGKHRLFVWIAGSGTVSEVKGAVPKGFQAESILSVGEPASRQAEILSDDGSEKTGGKRCSELGDRSRRAFRSWLVRY